MDFGSLPSHRPFDLRLPPLWPPGVHRLASEVRTDAEIGLGAVQWNIPAWVGSAYPKGTKAADYLEAYGRQWNAIELNTSFYRNAEPAQVRAWAAKTPEGFRFSVKVHQELSHDPATFVERPLRVARMYAFANSWRELGAKWSESFLQLPPGFAFGDFRKLQLWVEDWPPDVPPLHIEFRHASWYVDRQIRPEARDWLMSLGMGAVVTDTPGRRDVSHGTLTTDRLLVRFLAQATPEDAAPVSNDHKRLAAWAKRVAGLYSRGLRFCSFFVHTPDHVWVPALSRSFGDLLGEECEKLGIRLSIPRVEPAKQIQISLFENPDFLNSSG
jgi:uncharacterized protein YecE (DUF72 family)